MQRMTSGRWARSTLTLAAILGAAAATSAVMPPRDAAQKVPTGAHLMAYGSRGLAPRSGPSAKLDGALADLARHADRVRPQSALLDLRSLNPAARFMVARNSGTAYVVVDAITRGDAQSLKSALVGLGLLHPSVYLNDVSGWLPISAIEAAASLPELHSIRAALARTNTGAVTSQGDFVQGTAALRSSNPTLTGSGITVGILSDSYDCYAVYAMPNSGVPASGNSGYAPNGFGAVDAAMDISTGDLPAASSINILEEAGAVNAETCLDFGAPYLTPYGDEGRAMMQIVHDVAPGASLAFHTAVEGEADFANGIQALATAGAQVIADDVTYYDEPLFQDGLMSQAVDTANSAGVVYFSAAGNDGSNGYDNLAPSFATASTSPVGEKLLNFDTTNATNTTAFAVSIPQLGPGEFIAVVLQWDQPYVTGSPNSGGATSQMDLCVTGSASGLIASPQNPNPNDPNNNNITDVDNNTQVCTGANSAGVDPYQILIIGFPANASTGSPCPAGFTGVTFCSAAQTISVQVGLAGGTAPGRVKVIIDDDGAGVTYPGPITPTGGTLHGHPSAAGAMAVAAVWWFQTPACGTTPAVLEPYSAKGGDPILFDTAGARNATPVTRQKPDIAGPDGGNDTFLGYVVSGAGGSGGCANDTKYPSFFGTSAATPHVAATAALLLQKFPGISASALYSSLKSGALTLTNDTKDGAVNFTGGYGFIQAESALADEPSAPDVTLSLSPTTINAGGTSTLSWKVSNATSCSASGSWSGTQALTGSLMVSPSSAGSYTYNLTCTNADGFTEATQVLTVVAPSGGGGGGGALDLLALLTLCGCAGARLRRERCA
jgi:subtilisin family serine protease